MDVEPGLVFRVVRAADRFGLPAVIVTFVILAATLVGVPIADHLSPAAEPIIAAPLRW